VKLIVGLGNPGKEYEFTRHNVGFRVVDLLAKRWRIEMSTEKFHAWFGRGMIREDQAILLKPTTFMNRSGRAVLAAVRFYQLEAPDLVTILDDVALELGRLRMRRQGSAGGHNGLTDVITRLGSSAFCRLRIGIGGPIAAPTQYVLSRFGPDEEEQVEEALVRAAVAIECWVAEGPQSAMNAFNAQP
jgi:PTH1 family peptidyl-tRNA hydrolase